MAPELRLIAADYVDRMVTVRTNLGPRAAQKLAEYEMDAPVYLSVVLDVPQPTLSEKAKRRGEELPPPSFDYVWTTKCGRTPILPPTYGRQGVAVSGLPSPRERPKLPTTTEYLARRRKK